MRQLDEGWDSEEVDARVGNLTRLGCGCNVLSSGLYRMEVFKALMQLVKGVISLHAEGSLLSDTGRSKTWVLYSTS